MAGPSWISKSRLLVDVEIIDQGIDGCVGIGVEVVNMRSNGSIQVG
jgi:hypothetical protein